MSGLMHIKEDGNDSIKVLKDEVVCTHIPMPQNTREMGVGATGTEYLNLYLGFYNLWW